MPEEIQNRFDMNELAGHIARIMVGNAVVPEFGLGSVPVRVAAEVYGKDADWVRAGIIAGWLPIGRATRDGKLITDIKQMDSRYGRILYTISPRRLWEDTGYVWKGDA